MSEENVEVVAEIFDGWSRGDFSVGKDLVTADFEWRQHAEAVEPGSRRGGTIASALRNIFEVYEDFRVVPDRFVEKGDKVVVIAHNRAIARGSGMKVDQPFAYVWTVRAGKLARVEVFADERNALEAAGLSE
jgi:ketosteroid isomerase-like protein